MAIVIVDDTNFSLQIIKSYLKSAGFVDVITIQSAQELYHLVDGFSDRGIVTVDLILMDILMPDIDGIEACRNIKLREWVEDVPIIVVTATADKENMQLAFEAGAMDFIKKPLDKIELLARVNSALRLKYETDRRRNREAKLVEVTHQLQAANAELSALSCLDGLTRIANRRHFDMVLLQETSSAIREKTPLSLIMLDIDYFKMFNDTYGHLKGDDCLKKVASIIRNTLRRPRDFAARYGGEEFTVILPNTDEAGAHCVAEALRANIAGAGIEHKSSRCKNYVTLSIGVITKLPEQEATPDELISAADTALYHSKNTGRNRVSLGFL